MSDTAPSILNIAYDLLETIRAAKIVDDDNIDVRLLYNWIHNQRAIWIKRKYDTIQDYDDNHIQTIIADVSSVNRSIAPTLPAEGTILRTINLIPATIELNYGNAVLEVTSPDLLYKTFSFVSFDQLRYSGNGKFNKNCLFVAIRDGYWYVKYGEGCNRLIEKIVIRAIFQNPLEVPGMEEESIYPINRHLIPYLKDMILKSDLRTILETKSDNINDSSGKINE